jgi:predicted 2-oxoglutarate/Fe(II)-dependent dioxygenase YbiX
MLERLWQNPLFMSAALPHRQLGASGQRQRRTGAHRSVVDAVFQ